MNILNKVLAFLWHNLASIIGVFGTLYFYLENRKFKKYDAEKEYRIASAELEQFDNEDQKRWSEREKERLKHPMVMLRMGEIVDRRPQEEKDQECEDFSYQQKKHWNEREKVAAKVAYYKNIKNPSLLWMFEKSQKEYILLPTKTSKLRRFLNNIGVIG